jgi:hypothetical protein
MVKVCRDSLDAVAALNPGCCVVVTQIVQLQACREANFSTDYEEFICPVKVAFDFLGSS